MNLSPEKLLLLNKIKRDRPDLIEKLKEEHRQEWEASRKNIIDATKRRAQILAGTKSALNQTEKKKYGLENVVRKKARI